MNPEIGITTHKVIFTTYVCSFCTEYSLDGSIIMNWQTKQSSNNSMAYQKVCKQLLFHVSETKCKSSGKVRVCMHWDCIWRLLRLPLSILQEIYFLLLYEFFLRMFYSRTKCNLLQDGHKLWHWILSTNVPSNLLHHAQPTPPTCCFSRLIGVTSAILSTPCMSTLVHSAYYIPLSKFVYGS